MHLEVPLLPKQDELMALLDRSPATWIGYGGSRGGTKSHGGRMAMLLRRLQYRGTKGLIIRRKWKEVYENHVDPLLRQFPQLKPCYHPPHGVRGSARLDLPNGSSIVFGYAEHPTDNPASGEIHDYQGHEYADILADEATHFTEYELTFLKTCNRWPSIPNLKCNLLLTMNPGSRGHVFCKRVFIDREYTGNERAQDYAFLRAYGWDNIEWVRGALAEDKHSEYDYYHWTDDERYKYFLERSDYGRSLDRLKGKMRQAHLMGDWDAFAGQFFDVFDSDTHVQNVTLKPWWPRWISIDWGFDHPSAVYWHAETDERKTVTYREFVQDRLSPEPLAHKIVELSTDGKEREKIHAVYLSPDAFAKKTSDDTIAIQMGDVFRKHGIPTPERADNDRVGGWMLMYNMLQSESWTIAPGCQRLIECLPILIRDEKNREDVLKVDGDDPADAARYGLKSRLAPRERPVGLRIEERIHAVDPTSVMIWRSKFLKEELRRTAPHRFGHRASVRQFTGNRHGIDKRQ